MKFIGDIISCLQRPAKLAEVIEQFRTQMISMKHS
jgi:hypothetical protein